MYPLRTELPKDFGKAGLTKEQTQMFVCGGSCGGDTKIFGETVCIFTKYTQDSILFQSCLNSCPILCSHLFALQYLPPFTIKICIYFPYAFFVMCTFTYTLPLTHSFLCSLTRTHSTTREVKSGRVSVRGPSEKIVFYVAS